MPAAGLHLRLGPRPQPRDRAQAPLRQAAGALAADRDRPRALHPLLPLRALQPGDRRGLAADLHRARRAHVRRHPRRPPVRGAVQRQHHRALPGRRADLAALPLPRAALGHRGRRRHLHALPVAVQRRVHRPRRQGHARALAREPGRRRRLALRQGPLRLPGDPRRRAHHRRRWSATRAASCKPAAWDEALQAARAIAGHRGRAAALVGGQATNEEAFLLGRIVREGLGSKRHRLASRTAAVDLEPRPRAGRAGAAGERPGPRVRPHRAGARHRAARRLADPRSADPQGRAPQRRQAGDRQRPAEHARSQRRSSRSATRPAARPSSCRALEWAFDGTPAPVETHELAELLRDGGEDVVILWGESLPAEALRDAAADRRQARPGRPRRRRACSRCPPAPTRAASARPARCPTPAPATPRSSAGRSAAEIAAAAAAGDVTALYLFQIDPVRDLPGRARVGAGAGQPRPSSSPTPRC